MRITIDLDDPSLFEVVRAWHLLDDFGRSQVFGRLSSSGNGVHLKVHGSKRDQDDLLDIRRWIGDDGKRVDIDADPTHPSPHQVLWSAKPTTKGSAGEWIDSLDRLIGQLRPAQHQASNGGDRSLPRSTPRL